MSSQSSSSDKCTPHKTISAQDLINGPHNRSGFLRKRGKAERIFENLKLSKHVNWRQRFVVIADGCCYCFGDEVSKEPRSTLSLSGYNRVFRTTSDRNPFCFSIEPAARYCGEKLHAFSCSSENERKLWMRAFRKAMIYANASAVGHSNEGSDGKSDDYMDLEKPVYELEEASPAGNTFADSTANDSESDSNSDYDCLEEDSPEEPIETIKRRDVPLPPIPQEDSPKSLTLPLRPSSNMSSTKPPPIRPHKDTSKAATLPHPQSSASTPPSRSPGDKPSNNGFAKDVSNGPRPAKQPPPVAPKSDTRFSMPPPVKPAAARPVKQRHLSEKDCLYDNNDREEALSLLREQKELGTFLIRKSRNDDGKVLAVLTTEDVKEYKLFITNGQVSLDKKTTFANVDELLDYYSRSPLPNRQQTLKRSYSDVESTSTPSRYSMAHHH